MGRRGVSLLHEGGGQPFKPGERGQGWAEAALSRAQPARARGGPGRAEPRRSPALGGVWSLSMASAPARRRSELPKRGRKVVNPRAAPARGDAGRCGEPGGFLRARRTGGTVAQPGEGGGKPAPRLRPALQPVNPGGSCRRAPGRRRSRKPPEPQLCPRGGTTAVTPPKVSALGHE